MLYSNTTCDYLMVSAICRKLIFIIVVAIGVHGDIFAQGEAARSLGIVEFTLPERNWALEMNLEGFEFDEVLFNNEFKGRSLRASKKDTDLIFSAFLVPPRSKLTAEQYRDSVWKVLEKRNKYEQVLKYEKGDWAFVEGVIKNLGEFKGVNQKNVFGYTTRDDAWIDIHLSKVLFLPENEILFTNLLNTIRVIDYQQTPADNWFYGSVAYQQQKYPVAIRYFERALAAEKQKPVLVREMWYVLVDNLTMAYGISGDQQKAREIIDYGLTRDSEYPLFYYNRACSYAEDGDLEKAIANLETAFKFENNMLKGEKFPDPETDSSFKKYLNNPRFKEFIKTHK